MNTSERQIVNEVREVMGFQEAKVKVPDFPELSGFNKLDWKYEDRDTAGMDVVPGGHHSIYSAVVSVDGVEEGDTEAMLVMSPGYNPDSGKDDPDVLSLHLWLDNEEVFQTDFGDLAHVKEFMSRYLGVTDFKYQFEDLPDEEDDYHWTDYVDNLPGVQEKWKSFFSHDLEEEDIVAVVKPMRELLNAEGRQMDTDPAYEYPVLEMMQIVLQAQEQVEPWKYRIPGSDEIDKDKYIKDQYLIQSKILAADFTDVEQETFVDWVITVLRGQPA